MVVLTILAVMVAAAGPSFRGRQDEQVAREPVAALARLAKRSMQLQCTIQDAQLYLTDSVDTVLVERESFKAAAA